jgi:tetratricopeptide (TPR) repeat protein
MLRGMSLSKPTLAPEQSELGPYVLHEMLGEGGMGVVYRGEHRDTGEAVALKTVRGASSSMLASIRREIHALRRLLHPGVVRIVAEGVGDGLPWYAMELLRGQTLRDLLGACSREGGAARPLESTLTPLRRLCSPLAYLHGNGLVHRDLKPENVFLRPNGQPVLVDFGISARFGGARGREVLEEGGGVVGSEAYMAPEQILGERVDARADLYALGCILYEAVTGRPPFIMRRGGASVLHQHLRQVPVPPSRLVEGVPAELDALVLRLLAKQPRERLGYAEDVERALAALGAESGEPVARPRPQPYLYRPDFSGRVEVMRRLGKELEAAARGRGGRVFIGGESGVGKTRLALELATEATYRRLAVVTGECVPLGVGGGTEVHAAPLHPFRPLLLAISDRCREGGAAEVERLLGPRGRVLAAYEPTLARLPGAHLLPEPPPLPPAEARARVLSSLRDTLFAFAEPRPLLLVLDDLQWADELTLQFLQELKPEHLEARGVLLVGTYRVDELGSVLSGAVRAPGAVDLRLLRLDAASTEEMVLGMLALRQAPGAFVSALVQHSSGNPFFIAEYLRAAMGEGLLTRSSTGEWRLEGPGTGADSVHLPLPHSISELIERRLAGLGEDGRALARLAAVLGREVDGRVLAVAGALEETAVMEAIDELRLRQVLEEVGDGRLRFIHDKMREVAYGRIPTGQRVELHHRVAEALEQHHAGAPDFARHTPELAHHWSQAGIHGRASHYFALAGDQARAAYANAEAISFYEAALREASLQRETGASPRDLELPALDRVLESLGDVRTLAGRQTEAREAYLEALARVPPEERIRRASLHRRTGKALQTHHQYPPAFEAYAAAEAALGEAPESPEHLRADWWQEWGQLQSERLTVYYWMAQLEEMRALVERVRPIFEAHGMPRQRARFYNALVQLQLRGERYRVSAETVSHAHAFLRAIQEVGSEQELSDARCVLGVVLFAHDRFAEAEEHLAAALSVSERFGNVTQQARILTYLTLVHRLRGRVEETRSYAGRSLAMALAGKMEDYIGAARANQAWVAWRQGERSEAELAGREALRRWQSLSLVYPLQWMARWPLLALDLEHQRLPEALEHARALVEPRQQRLPETLQGSLTSALTRWEAGDPEAARAHLVQARDTARHLHHL